VSATFSRATTCDTHEFPAFPASSVKRRSGRGARQRRLVSRLISRANSYLEACRPAKSAGDNYARLTARVCAERRPVFFILMTGRCARHTVTAIMTHRRSRHARHALNNCNHFSNIVRVARASRTERARRPPRWRSEACQSANCHACTFDRTIDYRLIRFHLTRGGIKAATMPRQKRAPLFEHNV